MKIYGLVRAGKDPEVRYGNDNKPIARVSVACQRQYKDKNSGQYPTDWFQLTAFGATATFVEKYVKKGGLYFIEGEIRNNNYEKDGKTVYSDQYIINSIQFANGKADNTSDPAPANDGGSDGFNPVDDSAASEDNLPFV